MAILRTWGNLQQMTTFLLIHKEREVSPIAILVSFRGEKYRKSIGETVQVKQWNTRTKTVRITGSNPDASLINDRIAEWRKAAERTVNHFRNSVSAPTKADFFAVLEKERYGHNDSRRTLLVPYFDTFIKRYEGIRSNSQIKHYRCCQRTMREYEDFIGRSLHFSDIDMDFYLRFKAWFNTKGLSLNYLGEKIKILKVVMNDARQLDRLHDNDWTTQRGFATPFDYSDTIYLNTEQLMRMYHLDINEQSVLPLMKNEDKRPQNVSKKVSAMRKARDMFLIGAFTGLRFSDYSRLQPANFQDGMIRIRNKKTGVFTVVPEHWVVTEIVRNGYDFEHPLFEQKLNDQIKDVARLAGLDDEVLISRNIGGRDVEILKKRYELISSHTARRSFATNAYKAGIPTIAIMKITGHKRESTFMRYIRISEKENAELLKDSSFFIKDGVPVGVPETFTEQYVSCENDNTDYDR